MVRLSRPSQVISVLCAPAPTNPRHAVAQGPRGRSVARYWGPSHGRDAEGRRARIPSVRLIWSPLHDGVVGRAVVEASRQGEVARRRDGVGRAPRALADRQPSARRDRPPERARRSDRAHQPEVVAQ